MSVYHCLIGLKAIRLHRRMQVKEAAHLIGVQPTSYARFEAGTRRIYFDRVVLLAKALDCSIDNLTQAHTPDTLHALLGPSGPREASGTAGADTQPQLPPGPPPPPPPVDYDAAATILEGWGGGE